jgi:hypothetical protein
MVSVCLTLVEAVFELVAVSDLEMLHGQERPFVGQPEERDDSVSEAEIDFAVPGLPVERQLAVRVDQDLSPG